ncbi:MAG: tripartite tricarboxylate transporter substrate binding protein [Chitinophagaceae bacterium]|nr:tripartite tricarboxylate transporter substrate binding protein [Rubrivivax sp.]
MTTRNFLRPLLPALVWAALVVPGVASSQAFPDKPVTLVVGFPPGGALDTIGRTLADEMSKSLGQKVIVDNKPGAGGNIAVNAVLNAPNDGHTLLLAAINLATTPALSGVRYDPKTALTMVSQISSVPVFMLASGKGRLNAPADVIQASKATAGGLKMGSGGIGTSGHLAIELLTRSQKIPSLHVPYKGGAAANLSVISGEVDVIFDLGSGALKSFLDAGSIKPLAVMQETRSKALPDVKSAKELGLPPDTYIRSWQGIAVKGGTPQAIIDRLYKAVVAAADTPAFRARAWQLASDVVTSKSPDEFQQFHDAELARWTAVIKAAGIKAQ